MIRIPIKPLSVNRAWQGKRFKTTEYKDYETEVLLRLPRIKLPPPPYKVSFTFGFSNSKSDLDNPTKLLLDLFQKKYKFNDKEIYELNIRKKIVKKKQDYFEFEIITCPE